MVFTEFQRYEPTDNRQTCLMLRRDVGRGDADEPFHWQDTLCSEERHVIAVTGLVLHSTLSLSILKQTDSYRSNSSVAFRLDDSRNDSPTA